MPSKLLAVIEDPFSTNAVYVAEAAGTVKRVVLGTGEVSHVLRPSTALATPFTCLAVSVEGEGKGMLFAGAWDKTVYAWVLDPTPSSAVSSRKFVGHSDFIKCLSILPGNMLASGSSDKTIIIWDISSGSKLHTLTGHLRAVSALATDPLTIEEPYLLFSGDSTQEIRAWSISRAKAEEIEVKTLSKADSAEIDPLLVHETSIHSLTFTSSGDLVTTSADKSAKLLSRHQNFGIDSTFLHADFVGSAASAEVLGLVVTGCRDEDVRVWDVSSGKCVAVLRGHWEDVTGLALLRDGKTVVSVSIDGTVRTWGLGKGDLEKAVAEYTEDVPEEKTKGVELTEDEERELAELMGDDDD
jgi:WD40 repeat protein